MNKTILKDAEEYVKKLYKADEQNNLVYHNFQHSEEVVEHINEIAAHYNISEEDTIILNIAGWFHDVGHLYVIPKEHEDKSIEIVSKWARTHNLNDELIKKISNIIASTRLDTEPLDLLQRIIKDADTYHFGTKKFKKKDALVKEEMGLRNFTTKLAGWNTNCLELLVAHKFYTEYAKELLEDQKEKNIARIKRKTSEEHAENSATVMVNNEFDKNSKDSVKQNSILVKGIQTMLRLTSENHMNLSNMADSKANILISVNAIIISLILSVLIRKIQVDTYLTLPTLIFLATSVITIVLAIVATRPKVTKGDFTREDVINRKTNLLFFGNFYKAPLDEYKWAMTMMMKDPNYLYSGLVDDIYYLGVVLGKKYKLLSIAYYVFMIGIVLSVVAFIVAMSLHKPDTANTLQISTGSPF
jgi:predicted metal-dependent HD superfamily phosphohydrolase